MDGFAVVSWLNSGGILGCRDLYYDGATALFFVVCRLHVMDGLYDVYMNARERRLIYMIYLTIVW